jgi:BlaI family transcriptional regulator, penicillinase repressor
MTDVVKRRQRMKKVSLSRLTPAEVEIMNAVWEAGELTVTDVLRHVNAMRRKKLIRSTIQVQVNRLEEKGWLAHREDGNRFIFRSTIPRQKASAAIARDIGERVFGGSCVELVKAFFSQSAVSPEEIRKLRELIDKYEE